MSKDSLLATCLSRLGWSPERLAREINRAAGPDSISAKAPYGWLNGACPRGSLPHLVADILTEHLRTTITAEQLWPDQAIRRKLQSPADTGIDHAWSQEATRRTATAMATRDTAGRLLALQPLTPAALNSQAMNWLINVGTPLQPRRHGDPLTPAMIEAMRARILDLRQMDDARGGTVVLDWAAHDLQWACELVRRSAYDVDLGVSLHSVLAELAQLTGWLACDANRHAEAQRFWLLGLHAAQTAGDAQLGANIVSCLSYQAVWSGNGTAALTLIKVARKAVQDRGTPAVQALLATRQARAHALLGDRQATERALNAASEHMSATNPQEEPTWIYWVTSAVLAGDAGRAWLDLHETSRAEDRLLQGLDLFGTTQPRNRMLHSGSLAEARLRQSDVYGAAEAAHAALDLTPTMNSGRAAERLQALEAGFAEHTSVVAREITDRIRTLTSHPPQQQLKSL